MNTTTNVIIIISTDKGTATPTTLASCLEEFGESDIAVVLGG